MMLEVWMCLDLGGILVTMATTGPSVGVEIVATHGSQFDPTLHFTCVTLVKLVFHAPSGISSAHMEGRAIPKCCRTLLWEVSQRFESIELRFVDAKCRSGLVVWF